MVRGAVPPKLKNLKKKNEVEKRIQTKGIQDEKKGEVCGLNLFIKSHYNVLITYFVFIIFPCLSCLNQFLSPSLPHLPACDDLQTYRMRVLYCLMIEVRSPALSESATQSVFPKINLIDFVLIFGYFFHQEKNCRSMNSLALTLTVQG